jgi:hypothetical protein
LHISEYRPGTPEYLQATQQIDLAMMSVLWRTQEISQYGLENEMDYSEIEVELALRNQAAKSRQRRA